MGMIERVARALLADAQKRAVDSGCDIYLVMNEGYVSAARAAIEAMMEPTPKMIEAFNLSAYPREAYDHMVRAALSEEEKGNE